MKLTNEFTVPAPADEAFAVLLDVERVAPCLPGAALSGGDGETFDGAMTIKLGPVTSRFEGTVRIVEADRAAHRAVLRAEARDARGTGTAAATITTSLRAAGGGTRVQVETDLQVSGPVAQFGRGVMQDVSGKLMRQFADCLAEEMQSAGDASATAGPAVDDVQTDGTPGRGSDGIAATATGTARLSTAPRDAAPRSRTSALRRGGGGDADLDAAAASAASPAGPLGNRPTAVSS